MGGINALTWMHLDWCAGPSSATSKEEVHEEDGLIVTSRSSVDAEVRDGIPQSIDYGTDVDMGSPIRRQVPVSSSFVEIMSKDEEWDSLAYRPRAGTSTIRLRSHDENPNLKEGECKVSWMSADPSIIQLRGQDYITSKKKIPSPTSLYEMVEMDAFDANEHMTDVGQRFHLPDYDYGEEGPWCAPDTLI